MKKAAIIFILLLCSIFIVNGETKEEIELIFNEVLNNKKDHNVDKLIGLETFDSVEDLLVSSGGFVISEADKKFYGYLKRYVGYYILIMTKPLENEAERIVDVKIIPKFENEYLSKHTGFIGDKSVGYLTIITDRYPPFTQETINTYRLVYYFDCDSESIIDVTDRELIVYND